MSTDFNDALLSVNFLSRCVTFRIDWIKIINMIIMDRTISHRITHWRLINIYFVQLISDHLLQMLFHSHHLRITVWNFTLIIIDFSLTFFVLVTIDVTFDLNLPNKTDGGSVVAYLRLNIVIMVAFALNLEILHFIYAFIVMFLFILGKGRGTKIKIF